MGRRSYAHTNVFVFEVFKKFPGSFFRLHFVEIIFFTSDINLVYEFFLGDIYVIFIFKSFQSLFKSHEKQVVGLGIIFYSVVPKKFFARLPPHVHRIKQSSVHVENRSVKTEIIIFHFPSISPFSK